jgi:hypothetical protein
MSMPVGIGSAVCHHPGDVAVGMSGSRAQLAHLGDHSLVARPVEDAGDDLVRLDALGLGERADVVGRRLVEVDVPSG